MRGTDWEWDCAKYIYVYIYIYIRRDGHALKQTLNDRNLLIAIISLVSNGGWYSLDKK